MNNLFTIFICIIESEEDLIDIKPKKRQKSKVVQSLKLKFKKEDSPKYKDDQEIYNETGKSIVHVNNEELNSSEMVFFCIPKSESSVKMLPKKKSKDVTESVVPKECVVVNQLGSETMNVDTFNSDAKNNEIDNKDVLNILNLNNVKNLSKEIKTEFNLTPSALTIDIVPKVKNEIELKLTSQSINSNFSENQLQPTTTSLIDQNDSNKTKEIKIETVEDIDINSIVSKKQCDNQNISTTLPTDFYFSSNTVTDIDEPLDGNLTTKSEVDKNLPECCVDVQKQDNNEFEKQLINKWTIDEDKIILQTCKRVEDIEVLLETINRRIPQRSVSEVRLTYIYYAKYDNLISFFRYKKDLQL